MALTKAVRQRLSRAVTAISFIAGAIIFWRLWQEFGTSIVLLELSAIDWGVLLLLPIPAYLVLVLRTHVLLRSLGMAAPIGALTAINTSSQAIGSLLPGGIVTELGFRTFYYTRSGLPADVSILVNAADGFVRYIVNSVLLFLVALYFLVASVVDDSGRIVILLGLGLSLLGIFILAVALFGGLDAWFIKTARKIGNVGDGVSDIYVKEQRFADFLRRHKKAVWWAGFYSAIGFFLEPLQLWVLLAIVGIPLPLWAVFWLTQALVLPRVLPVPGAVGVAEESGIQFARLIGQVGAVGFVASVLWRIRLVPYIIIGLLLVPFLAFFRLVPGDKMRKE